VDENGVAWVTASAPLVAAVRTAKQYLTYVSAGPFQYAVAEALRLPDSYFTQLRADLLRKRDLLATGLRAAGFEVYDPQGTYFITTDITPFGEKDAYAFCRALPERCGVVAIPNSVFYDDPDAGRTQVRFTFCKQDTVSCKQDAVLQEAVRRLDAIR
jgi:N-succinyldiaminopimelate aminotransferase